MKAAGKSGIEIMNELGENPKAEWEDNVEVVLQGVPIPKGFEYIEGTKDTGLVVKNSTDNNEFVWVPVPNPNDMYWEYEGQKVGQIYDYGTGSSPKDPYEKILTYDANDGTREPAIITGNLTGDGLLYDGLVTNLAEAGMNTAGLTDGLVAAEAFKSQLQEEFDEMAESVEKYKGFYVGRYETTGTVMLPTVQKGKTVLASTTWYQHYKILKDMYKLNGNVASGMIWGCQYDQIMLWMQDIDNPHVEGAKYITNSTGMGNHTVASGGTGVPGSSGSSENYRVKNIYDLAGNLWDMTLEARGTNNSRGFRRWLLREYW